MMLKLSNKVVLGNFPRMTVQKLNRTVMLDLNNGNKKSSNKNGKKKMSTKIKNNKKK